MLLSSLDVSSASFRETTSWLVMSWGNRWLPQFALEALVRGLGLLVQKPRGHRG